MDIKSLQKIGEGATAEVFLDGEGRIIKLFFGSYPREAVEYEYRTGLIINHVTVAAPQCYEMIQVQKRHGIVYQYIPGELLFNIVLSDTMRSPSVIKRIARLQVKLNKIEQKTLPDQKERLLHLISKSPVVADYYELFHRGLVLLSREKRLCHGDFHVGNIIESNGEYTIIDWMNAYSGDPQGDLIRSYLMLISPYIPIALNSVRKVFFSILKWNLGRVFLREYLRNGTVKRRELKAWIPIIAAARLSDQVPGEEEWLLKLIQRNLKHLKQALRQA